MQNLTKLPDKAWISLLWSQYNVLSEPVKEGFINLAHKIAEETNISAEGNTPVQKVSDTHR
jgi:hypothetical protein